MRKEDLFEAIGNVDEKYLERSEKTIRKNAKVLLFVKRFGAVAACFVVLLLVFVVTRQTSKDGNSTGKSENIYLENSASSMEETADSLQDGTSDGTVEYWTDMESCQDNGEDFGSLNGVESCEDSVSGSDTVSDSDLQF